ncbi:MAG: Asp-tRNA(Asn)/Glu-tRNA(Gln) amidotransferase GatCAB subunit B, partial [Candidatus Latescibacterota bacterium]|nr:Asp-tRNA(Asn)/Glu-tRNA(Gln) amidotransferase GatCAB subunit B [Candidatus Latescibacterota bacterium]
AGGAVARTAAIGVKGQILRIVTQKKPPIFELKIDPKSLGALINLIDKGTINGKIGKKVFQEMADTGDAPDVVVERLGLAQISDKGEMESAVDKVLADHPDEVVKFKAGNKKLMGFLMGQVMKATEGQANPKLAAQLVAKKLG